MRTKWLSPVLAVLAAGIIAVPASAQTIAYTNFLQFDLQSFTSQATGGMFDDDIENVGDASKLMNVEGNRLFTSFSNLADPAGMGDNILSYSVDHPGLPSGADHFDTGSYLVGWIGKYDKDSEYNLSVFYQRNSGKSMFEDLQDGNIGFTGGAFDAEYVGSITTTTLAGTAAPNEVLADRTTNYNLMRYDERSATDFDLGAAKDISEDLSFGARIFFEKDQVNSFAEGTVEVVNRADADSATGTQLGVTSRTETEYVGLGEEAFRFRNIGIALDGNYHEWDNQSVGFRLDIFGASVTNPGFTSTAFPSTRAGDEQRAIYGGWIRNNLRYDRNFNLSRSGIHGGGLTLGGFALGADHESRSWSTDSFNYPNYSNSFKDVNAQGGGLAVQSVDDTRDGIGINGKAEYNREWAGGDINSWAGFGRRSLDIEATVVSVDMSGSSFWWSPDGVTDYEAIVTSRDETFTVKRDGDMTTNTLELGGRWNRDLNSNVSLGIGAVVTQETTTDDYQQTNESVIVTNKFEDGSPTANALFAITSNLAHDEDSTTRTVTNTFDVEDEVKSTLLRLPVGTQFHFKKRWTFNMGATHTLVNVTRETIMGIPADGNGLVTTTTVGTNGAPPPVVSHPTSSNVQGTTVTDKFRTNHTTYWYGISVDITDAVQLDVNGFLDTDSFDGSLNRALPDPNFSGGGSFGDVEFWRNLAISMKYIFW